MQFRVMQSRMHPNADGGWVQAVIHCNTFKCVLKKMHSNTFKMEYVLIHSNASRLFWDFSNTFSEKSIHYFFECEIYTQNAQIMHLNAL